MSGYGPTDTKGCIVFILILPFVIAKAAWGKLTGGK